MIDYKKVIKSRNLRMKILQLLSFVPDKTMLKIQYRIKTGRKLNIDNPKRFTEKLQWYKLYYRDPLMISCVDKYDVRDYVASKGLERILVACYGIYDSPDKIEWDKLPNQFVMKDTLGSGGNAVIIVKDKKTEDLEALKKHVANWVAHNPKNKNGGREWPYYSGKKHRILIEEYLQSDTNNGGLADSDNKGELIDYKFLCFNGKIAVVYILADRKMGQDACCGIFDDEMNKLPCIELDERPLERIVEKPENYETMKRIAEKLSEDFPEARIDLYNNNGRIRFGEITFYDSSGYMIFDPDSFDTELGEKFRLPKKYCGMV